MPDAAPEVSVVTITYNEAENIEEFIEAVASVLRGRGRSFEIVVVDDDSPDGTAELVACAAKRIPGVRLVRRKGERGIGSAYLRGIQESVGKIVVTMDADFSHPPDRLPALLTEAEGGALALGSRFLRPGDFVTRWIRWLPTRSINEWHRRFLGTGIRDHTNGYLAVVRENLQRLLDEGDRIGVRPFDRILYGLVLSVLAHRLGIPVFEVSARYIFRTRGETKIQLVRGMLLLVEEWTDSLRLFPFRASPR